MRHLLYFLTITLLAVLLAQSSTVYCQTRVITGTVINAITGNPIPYTKVELKGTAISTISSSVGKYSLVIPDSMKTIEFSNFFRMNLLEIRTISSDQVDIYLSERDFWDLSLEELMEVKITTAGKQEQSVKNIPASVVIITRQEIETYGYQRIESVLNNIPGLYSIDDYGEGGTMFGVRGFLSGVPNANLIILINGVPQTKNIQNNYALSEIPVNVESIDRIEVVRGPLSVIYGNGAFYGAINIITNETGKQSNTDLASFSIGSANTLKGALRLSSSGNEFKYVLNVSLNKTSGIDQPFSELATNLPAIYGLSKDARTGGCLGKSSLFINLSAEYNNFYTRLVLVESLVGMEFDIPSIGEGSRTSWSNYNLSIGYKKSFGGNFTLDGKITYYHDRGKQKYQILSDNFFGIQQIENDAYEITIDAFYKINEAVKISSGMAFKRIMDIYNFYDLPSFGIQRLEHNIFSLNKDDNIDTRAFYINSELFPFSNFEIVAGFRLEQASKYGIDKLHFENGNSSLVQGLQDREEVEFVPRIGGIYHFDENSTIKLLYGKAINRPSFFQNYLNLFTPQHTKLYSEIIETVELNFISTILSKYSFALSLFNNQLSNLITRVINYDQNHLYSGSLNANAGEMVTNGCELSIQGEPFKDFRFDASFTYQNTRDYRDGFENIYPAYSPHFLAYIKASYHFKKNYTMAFSGHYVDAMETYWDILPKISGSNAPIGRIGNAIGGYFVLDANFRIEDLLINGMYANFNCSNIFNAEVRYPTFTNNGWADKGTIGYGRFIQFSLGYKF